MEPREKDDAVSAIESEIRETKKYLDASSKRLKTVINKIVQGLEAEIFPSFIQRRIDLLMMGNTDSLQQMSDEELENLKAELKIVVSKSIADVVAELKQSKEWFTCEEGEELRSYGIRLSPELWEIFQSIDRPIVPVLEKYGLNVYLSLDNRTEKRSVLKPINWSWFITYTSSKELEDQNTVLANEKTEYCKCVRRLQELEEEEKKERALKRWKL